MCVQQLFLQFYLHVRNQYGKLGTGQILLFVLAFIQGFVVRNKFQRAAQAPLGFQRIDGTAVFIKTVADLEGRHAQCAGLVVVVVQHQLRYRLGHLFQQLVALLLGEVTIGNDLVQ